MTLTRFRNEVKALADNDVLARVDACLDDCYALLEHLSYGHPVNLDTVNALLKKMEGL